MKHTVVLGIGNRLMGDDGIGVRIAEALGYENSFENVKFTAGETDVDYCLNELAGADRCVIIDAARLSEGAGNETDSVSAAKLFSVEVIDLKEVFAQKRWMASFHDFDLFHAMKRENMIREGILIAVGIGSVEFSGELSPEMTDRFGEICVEAKNRINRYLLSGATAMGAESTRV